MGIPVHGNYNKYVWIGMARMEMASDLKTSGSFCPCVSDKISKN